MSLINEALKKAQRLRTEDQVDAAPIPGSGGRVAKRAQARSANTMVLIGAGALVLVVLSVVLTVYLVNRPAPANATAVATAPTTSRPSKAAGDTDATVAPVVTAPVITAPQPAGTLASSEPAAAAIPTVTAPAPASEASTVVARDTTPAAVNAAAPVPPAAAVENVPPPAASAPATAVATATSTTIPVAVTAATPVPSPGPASGPAVAKPDERVAAYIDTIRVTATRASEGRVLMNERVYRVNDLVERTLGVRLVKVAVDSLTFADANGVTYVKYF